MYSNHVTIIVTTPLQKAERHLNGQCLNRLKYSISPYIYIYSIYLSLSLFL